MSGKNPVPNEQAYEGVRAVTPPNLTANTTNPASNVKRVRIGDIQVNKSTNTAFMLTSISAGAQTWTALGSGTTGAVVTLTASSGGAISPSAGNINILGTANQITTAGAGSTITFTIPSTFIAPGSIASTTTVTAGTALVATTSVTAGTSITATLGNITATNGNLVLGTAGNKLSVQAASNTATAGANSFGTVTLITGTITVATTAVTASSIILLTRQSVGSSTALGQLTIGTVTAGVSFVISAATQGTPGTPLAADASVIGWMIIN